MSEKYEQGMIEYLKGIKSLTQISHELKINRGRLSTYIKKHGYVVINKQNDNNTYNNIFSVIDSEEKAYWLGFLYADGYVSSKTNDVQLSLQGRDKSHLEKFKNFLNSPCKIREKHINCNGKDCIAYSFNVNKKQIHDDLIKLGCIPNKSLVLQFPTEEQVPSNLLMPFLRGYIDGDGYIRIKKSKTFILRLSISCGSKTFLERLLKRTNWPQNSIHKDKRSNLYNIEWSSIKNNDLIIALYENANIFLDRKYEYYLQLKNAVSNQVDIEV